MSCVSVSCPVLYRGIICHILCQSGVLFVTGAPYLKRVHQEATSSPARNPHTHKPLAALKPDWTQLVFDTDRTDNTENLLSSKKMATVNFLFVFWSSHSRKWQHLPWASRLKNREINIFSLHIHRFSYIKKKLIQQRSVHDYCFSGFHCSL